MTARTKLDLTTLFCVPLLMLGCSEGLDDSGLDAGLDGDSAETGGVDDGGLEDGDSGQTTDAEPGDGDGDADDDGDGDGNGDDGDQATFCGSEAFALHTLVPNVMLVLDKSGSMNRYTWDDDDDPETPEVTRWHTLHGVVSQMTEDFEDVMNMGVTLFPAMDAENLSGTFEGSCKVEDDPEVPVGPNNAVTILDHIPAADDTSFTGGTPATKGVVTATGHLLTLDEELPQAMIFVTDGAANCVSPQNFVSLYDESLPLVVAEAWQGLDIPTYVVGIDITEDGGSVDVNPREALHDVALAGAVPREGEVGFYDATTPAALADALADITERVGCQVELNIDPEAFDGMVIETDDQQEFGEVQSCENQDGWIQIDPQQNPSLIELCNAACDAVDAAGGAIAKLPC